MENPMRPQLAFAVKRKQQPGITRRQLTREERVLIDAATSRLGTGAVCQWHTIKAPTGAERRPLCGAEITFREYDWGSDVYGQALILRNRLLRRPLGLCLYDEELGREKQFRHIGAFLGGSLIATLLLVPGETAASPMHMKQVAVEEPFQRQGIGRKLLAFTESLLREEGIPGVFLHARQTAVGFYEKAGYTCQGEAFLEVGIPHRYMEKHWG